MNKKKLTTKLIKGGINRSKFMETSDPIFLTSGFIYQSAEEAEKSFKEEKKRLIGMKENFKKMFKNCK